METQYLPVAPKAQPVLIRAFGTLTVDTNNNVSINGQDIANMIAEHLGITPQRSWDLNQTVASVRIDIEPITTGDIKTIVNGKPYPAPTEESAPAEAAEAVTAAKDGEF